MNTWSDRPSLLEIRNGERAVLPFSDSEYESRLSKLRLTMSEHGIDYVLLTSMHNIAYYTGFLYCAFGRPYGCVISHDTSTTITANIDAGQPARRGYGSNITYTDWHRNNYWRGVKSLVGEGSKLGIEGDHLTLSMSNQLKEFLGSIETIDIAPDIMRLRMIKSEEEAVLIRHGARIADIGGEVIRSAISEGAQRIRHRHGRTQCHGASHSRHIPRCRIPRHMGMVPIWHQHRWRPQSGHISQALQGRHIISEHFPDDIRLLHSLRAHLIPRRARC